MVFPFSRLGDSVTKVIDLTQECKKDHEKMTESHLHIARDQKEAKLVEAYNLLLAKDTSNMSQEEKARVEKTLQRIEMKIFGIDEALKVNSSSFRLSFPCVSMLYIL
jgi:hypothetical protein